MFLDRQGHIDLAEAITARDAETANRPAYQQLSRLVEMLQPEVGGSAASGRDPANAVTTTLAVAEIIREQYLEIGPAIHSDPLVRRR
jgi:hypothetical protein